MKKESISITIAILRLQIHPFLHPAILSFPLAFVNVVRGSDFPHKKRTSGPNKRSVDRDHNTAIESPRKEKLLAQQLVQNKIISQRETKARFPTNQLHPK